MRQRAPEPRGGRARGGHARHDARSRPSDRRSRGQLPGHAAHAVDPGVAARDEGDAWPRSARSSATSRALDLLAELAADDRLARAADRRSGRGSRDSRRPCRPRRWPRRRRASAGRASRGRGRRRRAFRVSGRASFIASAYQDQREVRQVFPERRRSGRGRPAHRAGRPSRPGPRDRAGPARAAPRPARGRTSAALSQQVVPPRSRIAPISSAW